MKPTVNAEIVMGQPRSSAHIGSRWAPPKGGGVGEPSSFDPIQVRLSGEYCDLVKGGRLAMEVKAPGGRRGEAPSGPDTQFAGILSQCMSRYGPTVCCQVQTLLERSTPLFVRSIVELLMRLHRPKAGAASLPSGPLGNWTDSVASMTVGAVKAAPSVAQTSREQFSSHGSKFNVRGWVARGSLRAASVVVAE